MVGHVGYFSSIPIPEDLFSVPCPDVVGFDIDSSGVQLSATNDDVDIGVYIEASLLVNTVLLIAGFAWWRFL
jgi:hypothetical protein